MLPTNGLWLLDILMRAFVQNVTNFVFILSSVFIYYGTRNDYFFIVYIFLELFNANRRLLSYYMYHFMVTTELKSVFHHWLWFEIMAVICNISLERICFFCFLTFITCLIENLLQDYCLPCSLIFLLLDNAGYIENIAFDKKWNIGVIGNNHLKLYRNFP